MPHFAFSRGLLGHSLLNIQNNTGTVNEKVGRSQKDHQFTHVLSATGKAFKSRPSQSRSQSFVPLDQRSENESSGSIRFEITMGNNRILVIWFTAQSQSASISCYGACLKWLLPELSFSDRWSRGTKLWERDCVRRRQERSTSNFWSCAVKLSGVILLPVLLRDVRVPVS